MARLVTPAFTLLLLGGLAGAQAQKNPPTPRSTGHRQIAYDTILFTQRDSAARIYRGIYSGLDSALRLVVRDSTTFANLWARVARAETRLKPPTPIRFASHDVIVAALGEQSLVGPLASIDTVAVRGAERIVIVRTTQPRRECMASTQVYPASQPADIVVVPHDDRRVTRFVERRVALKDCGWMTNGKPRE